MPPLALLACCAARPAGAQTLQDDTAAPLAFTAGGDLSTRVAGGEGGDTSQAAGWDGTRWGGGTGTGSCWLDGSIDLLNCKMESIELIEPVIPNKIIYLQDSSVKPLENFHVHKPMALLDSLFYCSFLDIMIKFSFSPFSCWVTALTTLVYFSLVMI